jgi:energy-coupling factor transport system ATP-binding protein
MSIVSAKNFTFTYPGAKQCALNGVSFDVERGEVLGIIGPVGAGKTTLCMAMAGLAPRILGGEAHGQLTVSDGDGYEAPSDEQKRRIGMVFEDHTAQLTQLKVLDEVMTPLINHGVSERDAEEWAREMLDMVGLGREGFAKKWVWDLSGGQQQRLAIAATLALDPQVLILDAVMDKLDPQGQEQVRDIIAELSSEKTLVVVEQNIDLLVQVVDRLLVLADGKVIAQGTLEEILRNDELLARADVEPPVSLRVARARGWSEVPLTLEQFERAIDPVKPHDHERIQGLLTRRPEKAEDRLVEPLVRVEGVTYCYPDGTKALDNVTIAVRAGEVHAVIGSSGSGKTTLLKHIVGLLEPTKGHVAVQGEDTREKSVANWALTVGTVLQNPDEQISERTVRDELAFPLKQRQHEKTGLFRKRQRYGDDHIETQVAHACELVGIEQDLLDRDPILLPRGHRKLVTIAEALTLDPQVLLLDEPTVGLGAASRQHIRQLIARLSEIGKTVLLAENDVDFIAEVADTVTVLDQGHVALHGPVRAVFEEENWDRLAELHLRPPHATQLARHLGMSALTCDELVSQLSSVQDKTERSA